MLCAAAAAVLIIGVRAVPEDFSSRAFTFGTLITGDSVKVPAERIKAAVEGAIAGTNFFTADLDAVRAAVETLPWVRDAEVRRRWPDAIEVKTHLHEVFGIYEDGRLVSTEGVVFSANLDEEEAASALPELFGPAEAAPELVRVCRAFDKLLAPLDARITDLMLSDRGGWSFVMSGPEMPPTRVNLGQMREGETPEEKLEELVKAYPLMEELFGGPPSSLDARYERAFAAGLPDKALIAKHRSRMAGDEHAPPPEEEN